MPPMLSGHRERLRTGPSEDRARDEVEYQQILEAKTEVLECVPCRPPRSDAMLPTHALNQAVRKAPAVMSQQFGVEDGRLLFVAGPISRMRRSPLRSAARQPLFRRISGRVEEPNFQRPICAEFAGSSRGLGVMAPD